MRIILVIGILATLAILAGCAEKQAPAVPTPTGGQPTPTTAPPTTQPPTTAPVALSGEDIYKTKCEMCHPAGDTKISGYPTANKGTWADALDKMKTMAPLTSEESSAVEKYLGDTYGVPGTAGVK